MTKDARFDDSTDNKNINIVLESFESKLEEVENECLILKEREADLLNQIQFLKTDNVDLRLKGER